MLWIWLRRHWNRRRYALVLIQPASDHPEWGEDRVALELKAKLGVGHHPNTIRRYMELHQGIEGIPEFGPGSPRATPPARGDGPIKIIERPVLGGLHHDYRLAA